MADKYQSVGYKTLNRMGDLYCLFYERGFELLKQQAHLCFITSNKWMRAGYGENLREFLSTRTAPRTIIDFAGQKVFESATVDTSILLFQKNGVNDGQTKSCIATDRCRDNLGVFVQRQSTTCQFVTSASWVILSPIERSIKEKIERRGVPLKDWDVSINYGIKTGFNDAFIVNEQERDEILSKCKDKEERNRTADLIRPILRGRDIKRYAYEWAHIYIIATFPALHIDISNYPAVQAHLLSFGLKRLEQSGKTHVVNGQKLAARKKTNNKWFETQDQISYWDEFSKPKIIWAELARTGNAFTFENDSHYVGNTGYILTLGERSVEAMGYELLLAFLNSKAILFYLDMICSRFDDTGWRWLRQFVELLPIPIIERAKNLNLITVVNRELLMRTTTGQQQVEELVNDCFGLTALERNYLQTNILPG